MGDPAAWQSVVPGPLRGLVVAARDAPGVREARRIFGGYERWRALHRTTGLFVAAGFVHGVLDGTPFDDAPLLRWSYVAVGAVGLGFYVYRELLARFFLSLHDYQVQTVREVDEGVVEIAMAPIGRHMEFVPGQFAMIYIEAKDGWHRHPFTITSAPHEDVVRVTVKALGDYTSRLRELIEPGMPAVIGGPHGRFSHWKGTDRQVWIAGGVGVAPFLSWLRALDGHQLPHRVDFFYSADGEAPFADEIRAIADRHESLHAHLIDTGVDGRLTSERVLAAADGDRGELSVFMCGPRGCCAASRPTCARRGCRPAHPPRVLRLALRWRRASTLPAMSVATQPHPALRWDGRRLAVLDQTRLPGAEVWLALEGAADTAQAIRRLAVRGAPLIGVAAAYGLAMEVAREPGLGTLETRLGAAARGAPDRGQPRLRRRPRPRGGAGGGAADDGRARRARRPSASTPRRTPPRRRSPPTAPTCWPARAGSPRTATPARWPPAARAPRWR